MNARYLPWLALALFVGCGGVTGGGTGKHVNVGNGGDASTATADAGSLSGAVSSGGAAGSTASNVDAGLNGPAACRAAGGQCRIGGSSCENVGAEDCNPNLNPGGAFCCLDPAILVPCNDGTGRSDCCPAGASAPGPCPRAGLQCSTRCSDPTPVYSKLFCTGFSSSTPPRWVQSEALWQCPMDGGSL
jgi:hypothetical protein